MMAEERPHILFGEELAAVRAEGLLEQFSLPGSRADLYDAPAGGAGRAVVQS